MNTAKKSGLGHIKRVRSGLSKKFLDNRVTMSDLAALNLSSNAFDYALTPEAVLHACWQPEMQNGVCQSGPPR